MLIIRVVDAYTACVIVLIAKKLKERLKKENDALKSEINSLKKMNKSTILKQIEYILSQSPEFIIHKIYRIIVNKEPTLRNNIEIIMECLDDEFVICEVYKNLYKKNCKFINNQFIISDVK